MNQFSATTTELDQLDGGKWTTGTNESTLPSATSLPYLVDDFCPNGTSPAVVWRDGAFTHCFIDTVSSSVLFGLIFLLGSLEIWVYYKWSTRIERNQRPKSVFFLFQILFTVLLTIHYVAFLLLRLFYLHDRAIYVYMVVAAAFTILTYPISLVVILLERRRQVGQTERETDTETEIKTETENKTETEIKTEGTRRRKEVGKKNLARLFIIDHLFKF